MRWKPLHKIVSETALGVETESKDFVLPERVAAYAGELLGAQLAGMAALLDPQAIILAGGLSSRTEPSGSRSRTPSRSSSSPSSSIVFNSSQRVWGLTPPP